MFKKLRNRLTFIFTFLLMIFLLVFIGITYFTFSYSLYQGRYAQAMTLVRNELGDHPELFLEPGDLGTGIGIKYSDGTGKEHGEEGDEEDHGSDGKRLPGRDQKDLRLIDGDDIQIMTPTNSFYYLISREGRFLHGDESKHELRPLILKQLGGWIPQEEEYRIVELKRKDESVYYLMSGREVVHDGKKLGLVYAGVDVTAEKNALDRFIILLGGLSILFLLISYGFGQLMAGRAMRPIRQSFDRQREFVADASHELRTPLSVIQASLDVIEEEEKGKLSAFSHQVLQDMKDETRRMGRLTQDLLTLARADSGAMQLEKSTFDLAEMAKQVVRTFQPFASQKGILLSYQGVETLPIHADRERIHQLLTLLIDNGIKYTPEKGEVKLLLHVEGKGVRRRAVIAVKDTGIGIPTEKLSRIFDRFYRVDKARSREAGGSGLGLSIAKWIVASHGGEIGVESVEGEGTTFTVRLHF